MEDKRAQEFLLEAALTQVSAFAWTAGASALDSAPGQMDTKSQGQFKTARGSGAGCVHGKCPEPASPSTESGSLLSLRVFQPFPLGLGESVSAVCNQKSELTHRVTKMPKTIRDKESGNPGSSPGSTTH